MPPKARYVGRHRCPHCGGPAPVRTIRPVTALVQEHYLNCADGDPDKPCGWRGVASFELLRTTSQPANPNPRVRLPIAATRTRPFTPPPPPANDDQPAAAEAL